MLRFARSATHPVCGYVDWCTLRFAALESRAPRGLPRRVDVTPFGDACSLHWLCGHGATRTATAALLDRPPVSESAVKGLQGGMRYSV